jgi:ferritin-like metal-binding protein YciE
MGWMGERYVARHAAIIGCCQAVEHEEISRYGNGPRRLARPRRDLLSGILDQEKAAKHKLAHIAIAEINRPVH